jgi:ribonuclease P protein component
VPRASWRLNGAAFAGTLSSRARVSSSGFTVLWQRNGLPRARLGIVVAKRIVAKAVARNACKRQVRSVFLRHHNDLIGLDIVVKVRQAQPPAVRAAARAALAKQFETARRWLDSSPL